MPCLDHDARGRHIRLLGGWASALLALLLVVTAAPAQASPPGANGERIAFNSRGNVWLMRPDGLSKHRVTDVSVGGGQSASSPAWAPDGTKFSYVVYKDLGTEAVHVLNADGIGDVTVFDGDLSYHGGPVWSPDSTKLVFARSSVWDCCDDIFTVQADGTGLAQLTFDAAPVHSPTWSPDGSQIAWISERDLNPELYVMNADGTGETRLTTTPEVESTPVWSPDGSRIAFVSQRDGNEELYVIDREGAQLRLTDDPARDEDPRWAPDGSRIAFVTWRNDPSCFFDCNTDIYSVDPHGAVTTPLTTFTTGEFDPAWSPDGTRLVFARALPDHPVLFEMEASGEGLTQLTLNEGLAPDWQPIPCTRTGTAGHDVLIGSSGDDVLCGFGGNDTLVGGRGNDLLVGGNGRDLIDGGDGADRLYGGPGRDRLRGDGGPDILNGGWGADVLGARDGVDGNDVVNGLAGTDVCRADAGDRILECP